MTDRVQKDSDVNLAAKLEDDLLRHYGPVLRGPDLVKALGFPSNDAFRQALKRGVVPVEVFSLENRRGKYALAKDVAQWLATAKNRR